MGYTHYWTQKKDFSPPAFQAMAADVRCILDKSGVPLANGYGVPGTKPQFDKNRIWFNGVGPYDDHETMAIEADPGGGKGWAFCKTARKPYDKVVTAVLTYLAASWGYVVRSDGGPEEWADGVALAKLALPEKADSLVCPLKNSRPLRPRPANPSID